MDIRVQRSREIAEWPAGEVAHYANGVPAEGNLGFGDAFYAAADSGVIFAHLRDTGEGIINVEIDPFTGEAAFAHLGDSVRTELVAMPGWNTGGFDALMAEWHDPSSRTWRMTALAEDGSDLPGYPSVTPPLTTPPVRARVAGKLVALAGADDGRVCVFDSLGFVTIAGDEPGQPIVGSLAVAPFKWGSISLGPVPVVVAARANGEIRLVPFDSAISPLGIQLHPPGGRLIRPVLLAAWPDPRAPRVGEELALFIVDSTGWVDAVVPGKGGAHLSGFPYQLPSVPVGPATLADLSSDGRPAIVVQLADGRVTAIGMDGRPLPRFPAVLPQGPHPVFGSPTLAERAAFPRPAPLEYRDSAGRPVLLVPAPSGDLEALGPTGKPVHREEFPRAVDARWGAGASWAAGPGADDAWLLQVGGGGSWLLDSIPGLRRDLLVSFGEGVDADHSGFLSPQLFEAPRDTLGYVALGNLRAFPNPLRIARQQELRVGFDLARSSTVRVRLYDMRGRIVAETHWQGHPAGNVVALPAGALGSGLYECEIVLADGNLRKVIPVAIAQ